MLTQNITLALNSASLGAIVLALVDGPTNQRTVRRLIDTEGHHELTIAHQSTNENPGFPTTRSNVRLSLTRVDEETGKEYTVYAQLTLSIPEIVEVGDVTQQVGRLVSLLYTEGEPAGVTNIGATSLATKFSSSLTRLYGGEP
jgi:hypothetical protein